MHSSNPRAHALESGTQVGMPMYQDSSGRPASQHRLMPDYVPHVAAEEGLRKLTQLLEYRKATGKAYGLRIGGPPGSGKSTICKVMAGLHPPVRRDGVLVQEVVYVPVREAGTLETLYEDIMGAMRDPAFSYGNKREKRARLMRLLLEAKTLVLIFDEPHHLSEERARSIWVAAMQLAKVLINMNICVVLAGVKALTAAVTLSEEIARRFRAAHEMGDPSVGAVADLEGLMHFCNRLGSGLGGLSPVPFGEGTLFVRLVVASSGRPGLIAEIVEHAAVVARRNGHHEIALEDFATAWSDQFAHSAERGFRHLATKSGPLRNPFSLSIDDAKRLMSALIKPEPR